METDGETLGFFLPAPSKRTQEEWAEFDRATARMDEMMAATGLSEDKVVEEFKRWRASRRGK